MSRASKTAGGIVLALMTPVMFGLSATDAAADVVRTIDKADGSGKPGAPDTNMTTPWWSAESWPSLVALGATSWDEVFHSGRLSGDFGFNVDQRKQQLRSPNGAEQKFASHLTDESFSILNQGFSVIDPRLLTGNLGLRFAMEQSRQDSNNITSAQRGLLTDYAFDATVLGEKAYPISLLASRSQDMTTIPSGGTTRGFHEMRSIACHLQENSLLREEELLPWFRANLTATHEKQQQETNVSGQSFRRDDQRTIYDFDAYNGFETADLNFRYQHTDFINQTFPIGSYISDTASVFHTLDFGPNFNRHLDSRVSYDTRKGNTSMSNFSVDESLTVEHSSYLSSSYYYSLEKQSSPFGNVTTHNSGLNIQQKLYANLTASMGLSAKLENQPDGRTVTEGGQLGFSYNNNLPWGGRLFASLGENVQINDVKMKVGLIGVFEALYQAPPQLGAGAGFLLANLFIDPETVEVIDIKDGLRTPVVLGRDYLVVAEGDRTRIQPQPTSAIIQPGDQLAVSYFFRFDPSIKYQTVSRSMGLGANWDWIGVSVNHSENTQKPLSTDNASYLSSNQRDTANLDVHGNWTNITASTNASLTRVNETRVTETTLKYTERRFTQSVGYQPNWDHMFSLNSELFRIAYQVPERRENRGASFNLSADGIAGGGWYYSASLSHRGSQDTQMPSETINEAMVRLRRKWALLELALTFNLAERMRGGVQSMNTGFHASAIRRF
jgi:hypothetical protein